MTAREAIADRLIAVVRADSASEAERRAERLIQAGVRTIEVAFTVPGAEETISRLVKSDPQANVGAGTVRTADQARLAADAGAAFLFAPTFDRGVAQIAREGGVAYIPGVFTATEAERCLREGFEVVKLFPAEVYGPAGLKGLRAPLPDVVWVPTGGVTLDNIPAWLKAGAAAVGLGSALTRAENLPEAAAKALAAVHAFTH